MHFLSDVLPEDVSWGEYFEGDSMCYTPEDTTGFEEVTRKILKGKPKQQRWCRHGNACIWRNCIFRHERCKHYDLWLERGKRGPACRSMIVDPLSTKSPNEGGCMYDHRNLSKLQPYYDTLPASTESEILNSFMPKGLEMRSPSVFDTRQMNKFDYKLLIRSLDSNRTSIWYEEHVDYMLIEEI
jgi:hypothetical protein